MQKKDIEEFFSRLQEKDPSPESELHFDNPYTLLVAVVLSAQATDESVNKATKALFEKVQTPQQMLDLGESDLKQHIKTIGLFNNKARNVTKLSRQLLDDHGGEVPADRNELEKLAGVGRKTANVVMNVAFGEPTFAVDTHVFRVGNRTGLAPGEKPGNVETKLEKIVPQPYRLHAHHWLILHGRYVCTARKPKCAVCAVRDLCAFKGKTLE